MLQNWKQKKSARVFTSSPFDVLEKIYINPENKKEFTVQILEIPDWVNVIGVNEKGNILLINQYRFGTDQIEIEIPGGYIESGELPQDAAKREFKEETGYKIKNIKQIGVLNANPAIMNNKCFTFLAELSEKGDVQFDPNEIIETEFATPNQVKNYLKEEKITNAYVIAAFLWYSLYYNGKW
jgi:8-oxo-dGTP pyrophosphatase MutT (NUDIX family)